MAAPSLNPALASMSINALGLTLHLDTELSHDDHATLCRTCSSLTQDDALSPVFTESVSPRHLQC